MNLVYIVSFLYKFILFSVTVKAKKKKKVRIVYCKRLSMWDCIYQSKHKTSTTL